MSENKTTIPGVKAPVKPAYALIADVEQNIAQIVHGVNIKFQEITNQLGGFVQWTNKAILKIEREQRTQAIKLSVQDIATTSLVKILIAKGIMTEDQYKEVAQEIYSEVMGGEKGDEVKES